MLDRHTLLRPTMRRLYFRRFSLCCLLLLPLALRAQKTPIALTGTLATPQEIVRQGTVLIQNGRILAVGAAVKLPPGTRIVHTDGIIAPGLIDLHNHLTWNIFPRWKPIQEFGNRYDWQQKPIYNVLMTVPHKALVDEGLECEMERYAEVKAITEGETSVVGSALLPCVRGLARNLDYDPELGPGFGKIVYNVFPLQMTEQETAAATAPLSSQPRGALLIHLAEGAPHDAAAAREFAMLKGRGLLRPGVSLIHAVALKPADFAEMAKADVGFVWSPRSNLELYGDTANVVAALTAGVHIALAPDWSPTGSVGLLGELNYASVWNQTQAPPIFSERDLVMMATANAAELVGLSAQIGVLAQGHAADLIVVSKSSGKHGASNGDDAYWSLTHATPQDLLLVVIGGEAMYGDSAIMETLAGSKTEPLEICGTRKSLVAPGTSIAETEKTLNHALHQFGTSLAPLAECGD
jgi:5-methylthioadenosine/S-adenosylhomocysteine deaminase